MPRSKTLTRRQFAQALMALGASSLIPACGFFLDDEEAFSMHSVVVIGAGAAGIAAARQLQAAGVRVTVLEARDRIGGRIHTRTDLAPHPVELGAEFIHGSGVITWELLAEFGLETIGEGGDENAFAWFDGQTLTLAQLEGTIPHADLFDELYEWAEEWLELEGRDTTLANMLAEWESDFDPPLSPLLLTYLNNRVQEEYGADLDWLGVAGMVEASYAGDEEEAGNWRVKAGYSELLRQLAAGLDIRLNTPVQRIRWDAGVTLETATGNFSADAAIITLPLGVLQAGDVQFEPPLPAEKQAAINGLGLGYTSKIILTFQRPLWPAEMGIIYTTQQIQGWWRPGFGQPNEAPILTGVLGGSTNQRLAALPDADLVALALAELTAIFNQPAAELLVHAEVVPWHLDPYAKLGYSYGPVNGVGLRAALAAPLDRRLFWAGEATHPTKPATVHGAYESGLQAAEAVLTALRQ